MSLPQTPDYLPEFPCSYQFKVIGDGDNAFLREVIAKISLHAQVTQDAVRSQASRNGKYQSVSVVLIIYSYAQLTAIYSDLKTVSGLKMLL